MEQPTINENPTVLSVDPRRKVQKVQVFASSIMGSNASNTSTVSSSVADMAVRHALMETSIATHGKGVLLIKNMGIDLPTEDTKLEVSPFVYTPTKWKDDSNDTATSNTAGTNKEPQSNQEDNVTADDVFEIIRNIQDPEHPLTLEQLAVVSRQQIDIDSTTPAGRRKRIQVRFTPTIPHCSMATQIGLCLRVKLDRSLPASMYKTTVTIEPGTHASENAINKQLADKERVCAALENKHLLGIVNRCIMNGLTGNMT
jgi:metal-sulfur cluster biosynthetic enzyme